MSIKESRKNRIKNNPEKYRKYKHAKDARYYAKHRAERLEHNRLYRSDKKAEMVQRVTAWRKNNWGKVLTNSANRRARELSAEGFHTDGEWENLKAQYDFRCAICKGREPDIKLTRDHIIPLSRGGSNWIENIQPLCSKCNCQKWANISE